MLGIGSGFGLG
jgi:hypothetical protein